MDPKVRDIALLVIISGVVYFIYKEFATGAAGSGTVTSNTDPDTAASSNLLAPVTGLFGNGLAGAPSLPSSLPTSLDNLDSSINQNNPVASTPAMDDSGGNADDDGSDDGSDDNE